MRRLVLLALARRARLVVPRPTASDVGATSVTIGYADGSAVTLDAGSPELDRLLRIAAEADDSRDDDARAPPRRARAPRG